MMDSRTAVSCGWPLVKGELRAAKPILEASLKDLVCFPEIEDGLF